MYTGFGLSDRVSIPHRDSNCIVSHRIHTGAGNHLVFSPVYFLGAESMTVISDSI